MLLRRLCFVNRKGSDPRVHVDYYNSDPRFSDVLRCSPAFPDGSWILRFFSVSMRGSGLLVFFSVLVFSPLLGRSRSKIFSSSYRVIEFHSWTKLLKTFKNSIEGLPYFSVPSPPLMWSYSAMFSVITGKK